MRLFLVSAPDDGQVVLDVRFQDAPDPEAGVPVDLSLFADAAQERVRERYPSFTYDFARTSGLLDIRGWSQALAAYWLIPFSERSALRTRLVEDLYRLCLLSAAMEKYRPATLRVTTGDEKLWRVIARLAAVHGAAAARGATAGGPTTTPGRAPSSLAQAWQRARRLTPGILQVIRARWSLLREQWDAWRFLRGQASEIMAGCAGPGRLVAFYTRYPVLWERRGDGARERNFGTFPDSLARHGFDVVYPAVLSGPGRDLGPDRQAIRSEAQTLGVVFLESLLSVWEFLRVYLSVTHALRYLRWRWRNARGPICFDGLDVRELILRELDPEFLYGSELLTNCARAFAFRRFCRRYQPRVVFHPFEGQPMERALWAGVRSGSPGTAIVGTQGGMFTSNWLGWAYAPGEAPMPGAAPQRHQSALPDYVVAYGTLAHAALARYCYPDRVLLPGAIRYPEIHRASDRLRLPDLPEGVHILVACSASREETLLLLRTAGRIARVRPEVFLLLKFHFHNRMDADWEAMATALGLTRHRICEPDVATLLRQSRAVLLGSSSVVVEAIALGCMPVVFQSPGHYNYSPALDIAEAVFLCGDLSMIVSALEECIQQSAGYWKRRTAWPHALEKMAFRLDGRQDERLLAQLRERGVL